MHFENTFSCNTNTIINCFSLKFMPTFTSLIFSSPFSLHRCEWTGLMRFLPSMPLAQQHRAAVPITGWILALALLLALQVQFVPTK